MKTNVESLKALYVKLGGNLTDYYSDIAGGIPVAEYDLISDCIQAVSKKASSGGGADLPKPGTAGNVLTSTGDAWESSPVPAETIVVRGTLTINNGAYGVSDLSHSATAVRAYVSDGKFVFLRAMTAGETDKVLVEAAYSYGVDGAVIYSGVAFDTATGNKVDIIVMQPDNGSIVVYTINTPIPSALENGKILGVSNGAYALVDTVPPADAEYNGLVLGIKDGEYDFLSASRIEGGPICITISEDNGSYVTDIKPNQLIAALEAGSLVQVHYKIVTGQITRYVNYNYEALTVQEGNGYGLTVSIYDSNETTLRKYITLTSLDGDTVFSDSSI